MLANTKSKYEHKNVIFGYLSKLRRSSVLLGTVPSNPKVTGDRSPVSPVVVTRLRYSLGEAIYLCTYYSANGGTNQTEIRQCKQGRNFSSLRKNIVVRQLCRSKDAGTGGGGGRGAAAPPTLAKF